MPRLTDNDVYDLIQHEGLDYTITDRIDANDIVNEELRAHFIAAKPHLDALNAWCLAQEEDPEDDDEELDEDEEDED